MEPTETSLAEYEPNHEYEISDVLVLDFDRMLGDVTACMDRLYSAAESVGIDPSEIKIAQAETEKKKDSFEPLSYIKSQLSPEEYELFQRNFIHNPGPEILYPDAQRFLAMLQYADVPHVVMTYGVNAEWQALKLRAAGYPMGCTIMDTPEKGAQLQALASPDPVTGEPTFAMEVVQHGSARYRASRLSFIDDKAVAFNGFPVSESYHGFWLQRGKLLPSQEGQIPDNVEIVQSLDELTVDESGRIVKGDRREMLTRESLASRHTGSYVPGPEANPYFAQYAAYMPVGADHDNGLFTDASFWSVPIHAFKSAA